MQKQWKRIYIGNKLHNIGKYGGKLDRGLKNQPTKICIL